MSFFAKLTNSIYLDRFLQFAGALILVLSVWKGVHGFWPTAGIFLGAAAIYVGKHFANLYRV